MIEQSRHIIAEQIETLQEQDIYLPDNANVHFHFVSHINEEDIGEADLVRSLMKHADILFIEQINDWTEAERKVLNRAAGGDYKAFQTLRANLKAFAEIPHEDLATNVNPAGFDVGLLKALYGSKIIVDCVDSATTPRTWPHLMDLYATSTPEVLAEKSLEDEKEVLADSNLATAYRELLITRSLGPRIEVLKTQKPKLQRKETVNALVVLGEAHTPAFIELCRAYGPSRVSRSFASRKPIAYSPHQQLNRAQRMGLEPSPAEKLDLVAAGLLSTYFKNMYRDRHDVTDMRPFGALVNMACRGLTAKDFEVTMEIFRSDDAESRGFHDPIFRKVFTRFLELEERIQTTNGN